MPDDHRRLKDEDPYPLTFHDIRKHVKAYLFSKSQDILNLLCASISKFISYHIISMFTFTSSIIGFKFFSSMQRMRKMIFCPTEGVLFENTQLI